ncbi:MAG TPA: ABC transporter substrate-binding protein [Pseudoflavonifractor sp.]|nr:ABC transporter substrate-binding protein [Pseudoflavonifractor sp.]
MQLKRKTLLTAIAAALTLSTLLSACGNGAAPSSGSPAPGGDGASAPASTIKWQITIPGKSGSLCNAPTYIAYEKGFFAEEGIDVELITADFEAKKVGLANGTIATINGDFQYFPSIEAGVEMTVVEGLHQGCIKLNVLPDSDIQGVKDLVGATIAVDEIGGTPYQVALLWLAQNGISADQVTFLPFNDGSLELEALYKGDVDVAALWDPLATTSVEEGRVRTILDISKDEPFAGHYCCFLYASNKVLKEDPALIAAELRAYHKAQNWIYENPEEAVKLVTEKQYVSIEDHDLAVSLVKSYGYPSTEDYEKNAVDVAADVEYFAQALYDIGFLTTKPEEYVRSAYTEVDLTLGQK